MTGRTVPEWIGKSPDTAIPPRVKIRVFDRQHKRCAHCTRLIYGSETPEFDHIVALTNGGENREHNIQALCRNCHKTKTEGDVAEKSAVARSRKKQLGLQQSRFPLPGSRSSKWKKKVGGQVVRRDED